MAPLAPRSSLPTADLPIIALTPGEPAGIGPDLVLALPAARDHALVILADPTMLAERGQLLARPFEARSWPGRERASAGRYLLPMELARPVSPGRLDAANSPYVIAALRRAARGCLQGEFDALVTGPVHKGVINDAGIGFTGHTEFLAAESAKGATGPSLARAPRLPDEVEGPETGTSRFGLRLGPIGDVVPVMMLACGTLRVALATTHLPLAAVPHAITREHLTAVIAVLHADLKDKFGFEEPRILVCGLNPHAGEGGHLGREEIEVIAPVVRALTARGMRLTGPVPADTAFLPAQLAQADAVLTMYHDQGLPVLKHHDFAHAVNVTLGLPFIRTSVDHGTALELAGTGRADPSSLSAAIEMAVGLVRKSVGQD